MKPYFQAGYDYKEFTKTFFGVDYYRLTADAKEKDEEDKELNQNWCERNLIIKDPSESKVYFCWELMFMSALLLEGVLVPYTACTNISEVLTATENYEIVIDSVFIINIVLSFCTPFTRDVDRVNRCGEIAEKYLKGAFFFDVLSTLPCVVTLYNDDYIQYTYLTKLLRVYHFMHFLRIMQNNIIDPIVNNLKLSKQTKGKIDFCVQMIINLGFVMHMIACLWLKVGAVTIDVVENSTYEGSWIDQHLSEE